jgi:signal transduction histidine kinase
VQADEDALYRALVNVVGNGLDAMAGGGRLTVRVHWAPSGEHRPTRPGGFYRRVQIEIEDTGIGIRSADTERVFNPFFTTKEGGTGLGLALTHKIVEDHGGSIDFRSVPGVATTFRIVLPLVPEPPANPGRDEP